VSETAIKTKKVYQGCAADTNLNHITLMAGEGREAAKEQIKQHREDGIKFNVSGDLWSENGTALLGLCGHFISRDWRMVNLLVGAVPCSKDSHTAKMVDAETEQALAELDVQDSTEEVNVKISDNGSNMKCGWSEGFWIGCRNHTDQLSINLLCEHADVQPTLSKCSGLVGYFNHSTLGKNLLHTHQKACSLPECSLAQWIKVRWRTCYYMCNGVPATHHMLLSDMCVTGIRVNMPAIQRYDQMSKKPGETYKKNKLQLQDYDVVEEEEAVLKKASNQNQLLEGVWC
jgi:hypothetical protein